MPKFLTVGQKREYMKQYHKEHPDTRRRYKPDAAKKYSKVKDPGARICLKCDGVFKSPDRVNFRCCPKCRETNKGLAYLEGCDS